MGLCAKCEAYFKKRERERETERNTRKIIWGSEFVFKPQPKKHRFGEVLRLAFKCGANRYKFFRANLRSPGPELSPRADHQSLQRDSIMLRCSERKDSKRFSTARDDVKQVFCISWSGAPKASPHEPTQSLSKTIHRAAFFQEWYLN